MRFYQNLKKLKGHGRINPVAFFHLGHGETFIMALIFDVFLPKKF